MRGYASEARFRSCVGFQTRPGGSILKRHRTVLLATTALLLTGALAKPNTAYAVICANAGAGGATGTDAGNATNTACGLNSTATGTNATPYGNNSSATQFQSTAVGNAATASGVNAIALGTAAS